MERTKNGSTATTSGASDKVAEHENLPGKVYFIRHGESTSNERNIFAGVLDVDLTAFGRLQARRAGLDIKNKGVKFDAVYVSHMRRARQTCEIALAESEALKSPDIPVQIDHRISEKSFGIFAGRNLNLLRLALGYEGFEEMLHSHNEAPPAGEKIAQVYDRAARFYEEKVVPHLRRGETVLVVCHQYVLEPLALYLSGLPPTAYKHLKLPNGKALSREELMKFRDKESGGTAALSRTLSIIAPIALLATLRVANLPINVSSLIFFGVILIVGLAIPGALAQLWRSKSPVESNHHSKNWKFIGVLAVALMALATGFQFTPSTFISDLFFSTDATRSLACLQQLAIATLIFVSMRLLAVLTSVFTKGKLSKAEANDAYILLVNPNFFLWAALFIGVSTTTPEVKYAVFWAALGFFCIPLIEQILFMTSFSNDILRETLRSSRVATEDVKKLFLQLDTDGSKALDRAEIMELLGLIEDMTTGERSSEEVRKYITDYLFTSLDSDKSGTVDLAELEEYVSTYGLVANLNIAPAMASPNGR